VPRKIDDGSQIGKAGRTRPCEETALRDVRAGLAIREVNRLVDPRTSGPAGAVGIAAGFADRCHSADVTGHEQ